MADDLALRRSIFTSDLPSHEKGALARVMSRIGTGGGLASVRSHVAATGTIVKEGAESLVVGGLIGTAEGYFGAEIAVPFTGTPGAAGQPNTNPMTVPVEGVAAILGYGAALMFPQEEYAGIARRAGNLAVGLWAARKAHDYVYSKFPDATRQAGATASWAGEGNRNFGVDRIAEIARSFK
jgi:hypothetical protein